MKVFQIFLLTIGLVVIGQILGRVSAQNSSNSNTAVNRYLGNVNVKTVNSNVTINAPTNSEDDEFDFNFGEHPKLLKIISMERTVKFPKNGELKVQLIEEVGKPFSLRFTNDFAETVANFVLSDGDNEIKRVYFHSAVDPKVRFRVVEDEGLPSPLIHLVIVTPGGSDYGFWSVMFGEVKGKIKRLTPLNTSFSWEGGIQIGDLGPGNGKGLAVWKSIWGDGESHYGEHFYQVEFYNFNKKLGKFAKTKQVRTKQKHETPAKALESLGLGFYRDAVRDFPEFLQYRENF